MWLVPGILTAEDVQTVYAEGSCVYCATTEDFAMDHILPMRLGGHNTYANLILGCGTCNRRKANGWEAEIALRRGADPWRHRVASQ